MNAGNGGTGGSGGSSEVTGGTSPIGGGGSTAGTSTSGSGGKATGGGGSGGSSAGAAGAGSGGVNATGGVSGSGGASAGGGAGGTGGVNPTGGSAGSGVSGTGGAGGAGGAGGTGGSATGGTTGGSAGGGKGGSAGIPNDPNWMPPDMTDAKLILLYQTQQTAVSAREVRMYLHLQNQTDAPYPLKDVTIRYWMSSEPAPMPRVDYTASGLMINGAPKFVANMANSYFEFSFKAGGQAPVYVDQNSLNQAEIQAVIATQTNNVNFDQSNDWSFDRTATQNKPNPKITMYEAGVLIWGCEPSHVCAEPDSGGGEAGAGAL